MKKTRLLVVLGLTMSWMNLFAQVRVEVIVLDVKDTVGMVRVGIFTDQESFLKKAIRGRILKATRGQCVAVFEHVPPGTYALSVVHDSNRNGKLDTNFFGVPKEGFGFSNDVMGTFGPPSFEKAKVSISSSTTIRIRMRYP